MKNSVSAIISDEYKNWKRGDKVLIATQTGTGKTTFVIKKLLPYAVENNKYIAYICNRRILQEQFLEDISKDIRRHLSDYDEDFIQKCLSRIIVRTYQYCETSKEYPGFKNESDCIKPTVISAENIMYHIFDEAHYFVQDALFNSRTNYWKKLQFNMSISVFLTATPEPLCCFLNPRLISPELSIKFYDTRKEYYTVKGEASKTIVQFISDINTGISERKEIKAEKSDIDKAIKDIKPYKVFFDCIDNSLTNMKDTFSYVAPGDLDFNYITPYYFEHYEQLTSQIQQTVNNLEKWVIFVNNEQEGIEYFHKLTKLKIEAAFISATTIKTNKFRTFTVYQQLIEQQKFDVQVLITTSVIDCGINIIDEDVRNIAISSFDKTEFLQMLGRVRVTNQKVNLYVKYHNSQTVNAYKNSYEEAFRYINNLSLIAEPREYNLEKAIPVFKDNKINSLIETNSHITKKYAVFYFLYQTAPGKKINIQDRVVECKYSQTAKLKFLYELYCINKALLKKEDMDEREIRYFYLIEQLSWIGKGYDKSHWIYYDDCMNNMNALIKRYLEKELKTEEKFEFSRECVKCLAVFPDAPRNIRNKYSKIKNDSSDCAGIKLLNKTLKYLDFPYKIISNQKMHERKRETIWCLKYGDTSVCN